MASSAILYKYIIKDRKKLFIGMLTSALLSILSATFLYQLQGLSSLHYESWGSSIMILLVIGLFVYVVLYSVIDRAYVTCLNAIEIDTCNEIRKDAYKQLSQSSYKFFSKKYFGEINTNIIQDIEQLGSLIFRQLPRSISEVLFFIVAFSALFVADPLLAGCLLGFIVLFSVYTLFLKRRMEKFAQRYTERRTELNTALNDYIRHLKFLRFYGLTEEYINKIDDINQATISEWLKLNIFTPIIQSSIEFATLICYLLVFLIGKVLFLQSTVTGATLFLFLSYMPQIWNRYSSVIDLYTCLVQGKVYANRIFQNWEPKGEISIHKRTDHDYFMEGNLRYILELRQVTFAYINEYPIISDFSCLLGPAGLYCLTGQSGCGKSTLFDLILGLYEPQSGEILLNGVPINKIENLNKIIGLVHQEAYMIEGSVIENIQFGDPSITKDSIISFLRGNNFLEHLPNDLNQRIPQINTTLTNGMKRIICIARVMLRKPKILLLDEVTAGLDSYTEMLILGYVYKVSEHIPCLLITHRHQELAYAKQVITFK